MKKTLKFIAFCLCFAFVFSLFGCLSMPEQKVELTKENWENYLTYQRSTDTSPITKRTLYGLPVYESYGTFTVQFYSTSNAKYKNVNVTIELWISTIEYWGDKSIVPLSERCPDDWAFTNSPLPQESEGLTYWVIEKKGILSNEGEISFSEPCEMLYIPSNPYGHVNCPTLNGAITVFVTEISGQVIVDKNEVNA